jgi:TadE-like protein
LILLILAIVQIGVLVHTRVLVTHAAREAVREAAVGASGSAVAAAAAAASGQLAPDRLAVSVSTTGDRVEVGVHYDAPTDVFLVGPLLGDVGFDASATMRREE